MLLFFNLDGTPGSGGRSRRHLLQKSQSHVSTESDISTASRATSSSHASTVIPETGKVCCWHQLDSVYARDCIKGGFNAGRRGKRRIQGGQEGFQFINSLCMKGKPPQIDSKLLVVPIYHHWTSKCSRPYHCDLGVLPTTATIKSNYFNHSDLALQGGHLVHRLVII